MKLTEIYFRDRVSPPGQASHSSESRITAEAGYAIDLDGGLVTIRKGEVSRLVPLSNVLWMTPEPAKGATGKK